MTSTIKVDKIEKRTGSTLTLGGPGTAVTLACGATQTGFGRSGSVNWQTTPKTATFTAASGEGYFANTSGGAFTINLPAGSAGAIVAVSDYTRTFATNNLTIAPNGSEKIGGVAETLVLNINGQALTLVYVDATEGWINVQNAEDTEQGLVASYVAATGGNATITSGDFKTHIFTGDGTLCVSNAGNSKGANTIDYFVVAGGGSGGPFIGAGGGAGGFRLSNFYSTPAPTMSPLSNPTGVTVTAGAVPVTVGAGGAFHENPSVYANRKGGNSVFSTITSTGGGGGGYFSGEPGSPVPKGVGGPGGSGGGGDYNCAAGGFPNGVPGGTGNDPSVSPPQGNTGGTGYAYPGSGTAAPGGGGGAGAVGGPAPTAGTVGIGGTGSFLADTIIGPTAPSYGTPGPVSSTRYFAGGGGGGGYTGSSGGTAGTGGGGTGATNPNNPPTLNGTANTGGGGGGEGGYPTPGPVSGTGGSGIVIVRYKFQN